MALGLGMRGGEGICADQRSFYFYLFLIHSFYSYIVIHSVCFFNSFILYFILIQNFTKI